jgi:hypothetical protein
VLIFSPGLSVFFARALGDSNDATISGGRHIAIPVVSHYPFETLLAGFLLLLAGNLFKGF